MKIKVKELSFRGVFSGELGYNDTKQYKVGGCDLGFPLYDEINDKLFLLFGDTFQENNFKYDWRSNTMCQVKELDKQGRIIVDHFLSHLENKAHVLSEAHHIDKEEMTRIPTGAICVNGVYYFYYFSMCCWQYEPDERMNMGGLVKSIDGGKSWEKVNEVSFLNDLNKESAKMLLNEDNNHQPIPNKIDPSKKLNHSFTQIFPKEKDGYVYLFAEGGYRNNPLRMGRVKKERIEDYDSYEYLIEYKEGKPVFRKGDKARIMMHEKKTAVVCNAPMGEMSVIYNPYLKKYCLFTVSSGSVDMFLSDHIYGPYTDKIHFYSHGQEPAPISSTTGQPIVSAYAPMVHEKMLADGGKTMYMITSSWIPCYNPSLYEVKFI